MEIGLLTAPFRDKSLEWVIDWASENGFQALEVAAGPGSRHLDPNAFSAGKAKEIRARLADRGVRISSLAFYDNLLDSGRRTQLAKDMKNVIKAAVMLEVDVVCTMAGFPMPGKDRTKTIAQDVPGVFRPLAKFAADRGIKIAFENWTETNIRNLADWRQIFEVLPEPNVGLNFDPSHLYWQGIDYLEAVDMFANRIFHTHAKDTEVRQHVLQLVGNQSGGWWRYVIPGFGDINWGVYISRLRRVGYNGVLSIEHEDSNFSPEEGFLKGAMYLSQFA